MLQLAKRRRGKLTSSLLAGSGGGVEEDGGGAAERQSSSSLILHLGWQCRNHLPSSCSRWGGGVCALWARRRWSPPSYSSGCPSSSPKSIPLSMLSKSSRKCFLFFFFDSVGDWYWLFVRKRWIFGGFLCTRLRWRQQYRRRYPDEVLGKSDARYVLVSFGFWDCLVSWC